MQLTTDGIILKDTKIDEDRILTILTGQCGVVTAFANGANRLRNKLASSTELLCYSRFVLFKNRERYVVDKADSNRIFFGIRSDLDKLMLASYLAELTAEVAPHGEDGGDFLRLLLNCLHYVETAKRDARLLKPLYELRALTLAGYMPNLVACCECGSYEAPEMLFAPQQSHLVCGACHGGMDAAGAMPIGGGVLAAMRHIIYSEPDKLFQFSLSEVGMEQLCRVSEAYLKYQLEKTFPTLEFYHSLRVVM